MKNNKSRFDPYKNFKFRLAFGAALAGIAGVFLARKVSPANSPGKKSTEARRVPKPTPAKPATRAAPVKRTAKTSPAKPARARVKRPKSS
jgi:hypothetical protein